MVYGYGDTEELLVNEIGHYSGEVQVSGGTVAFAIQAIGKWSIRKV